MRRVIVSTLPSLLLLSSVHAQSVNTQVSGKFDVQTRYYFDNGAYQDQGYQWQSSISIQPELYREWNDTHNSIVFKPFYRYDQRDGERTHADIRELLWISVGDDWELRTGVGKVFWGVTEFQHLVDTINQTDAVESFDGEEKLGQPMVNLSLIKDWGTLDAYILPGFRERTFTGQKGRLRPAIDIKDNHAEYESSDDESHIDYALRLSHSVGVFDFGIHWFKGTNRDPLLRLQKSNNNPYLTPYYEQMNQFGVDIQATIEAWLLKFEALSRNGQDETYTAMQAGFEYSFYGVANSDADIGVLLEYGWDDRGKAASSGVQNDVFVGTRLTLNDVQSTDLLIGASYDLDYESYTLLVEGSYRLTNQWKIVLDGQFFNASNSNDPNFTIRKDDYVQLTLEYYL